MVEIRSNAMTSKHGWTSNLKAPVMEKVTRVRLVLDPKSGPLGYLPYLSPLPLRPSHYCRCLSHGSHPAAPPPPHHHPNHRHHQPHNCLDSWLICFIRAPPPAFESSHVTAQISFLFFLIYDTFEISCVSSLCYLCSVRESNSLAWGLVDVSVSFSNPSICHLNLRCAERFVGEGMYTAVDFGKYAKL